MLGPVLKGPTLDLISNVPVRTAITCDKPDNDTALSNVYKSYNIRTISSTNTSRANLQSCKVQTLPTKQHFFKTLELT